MQIDSVRELKAQFMIAPSPVVTGAPILAETLGGGGGGRSGFRTINVSAQSLSAVEPIQRTVALGIARKGRKNDYTVAVRLQRRPVQGDNYVERLHKAARGEVDVRYVGRIAKRAVSWYQQRNRPIVPGCSVGHFKITAGTLGCLVADSNGAVHILSNNHVLANENRGKAGDPILQPGAYDGGTNPADRVGSLARFVRLKKTGANLIDCAIATIASGIKSDGKIRGLGAVKGVFAGTVQSGLIVSKLGRTTGLTHGRVTAFELDNVVVNYDLGNLRFDDQIEIEGSGAAAFSDGGDSGSLIVTDGVEAVGLLFAGGDHGGSNGLGLTYANPVNTVLQKLRVSLA
jgi:hypothetical protein